MLKVGDRVRVRVEGGAWLYGYVLLMNLFGNGIVNYTCEIESTDGRKITKVVEEMQVQPLGPQDNQRSPQPGHQSNVAPPGAQPPQASLTGNQGPGQYDQRAGPYNQYSLHNTRLPQDRQYPQPRAHPAPPSYGYPPMNGGYYEHQQTPGPLNQHTHSDYYPHHS